jgi:ABC-type lipoprotein release transport system permease subunit
MTNKHRGAQKHLNFLNYALGSLTLYRARTLAVIFSLTAAVFLLGSIVFVSDGLSRDASVAAKAAPDITVQGMVAGRVTPLSITYIQNLERIGGIERIVPRMWGYTLSNQTIYTVMGLDPYNNTAPSIPGLLIEQGRLPRKNAVGEAVIGTYLAGSQNLGINSTFIMKGMESQVKFTVVGIFSSDVSLYTSDIVLVNYLDAQSLLLQFRGAAATDLGIYLKDPASMNSVANLIAVTYPELRVLTRDSIVDATSTTYGLRGGFATIMWFMLLVTVVLVAWNQASTVGQDSRREVGILKTLGFGTTDIMEIRLIEALALGFISASIGVFLAIFYDTYLGAPFLREFMLGWSATLPAFRLPLDISLGRMLTLYAVAIFPLLLGSLVPAWLSAITEPDTVLRGS